MMVTMMTTKYDRKMILAIGIDKDGASDNEESTPLSPTALLSDDENVNNFKGDHNGLVFK